MSNVSFSIGGRRFTVACADGEEAHVAALGEAIDSRVAALGGLAGQSETRMLLFAALTLADEVNEQGTRLAQGVSPVALGGESDPRLLAIAERLENLALRLEAPAQED